MIQFDPQGHEYKTIDDKHIDWTSVTTLGGKFKEPFDAKKISEKSVKNKKSKWFGLDPVEVRGIWTREGERGMSLGNWYHDQREVDVLSCKTIKRYGLTLPVIHSMENEQGKKIASSQRLADGIYPEHLVYLQSVGLIGQIDLLEIANGLVYISDYKTNKKIDYKSYVNWEGISKKMSSPIDHLEDCNYIHYALQLSTYAYMVLRHNPKLKIGELFINHIRFKLLGKDKYDYPIYDTDKDGNYIVQEIVPVEVPYLKSDVQLMINTLK